MSGLTMLILMLWSIAYSLFSTDLGMGHECAPAFSGRLWFRCGLCLMNRRDGEGVLHSRMSGVAG